MITLTNIKKQIKNNTTQHTILKGINLDIAAGEFVVIVGKSGSGKSTLLNILCGIDTDFAGEVDINNQTLRLLNEDTLAQWRGENLGIVFQFFQLIPTLSVLENLLLPMDLVGKIPKSVRTKKAVKLLEQVGMLNHQDLLPGQLSGGEQQRVAVARALANDAALIVADEPTGNLDTQNTRQLLELLKAMNQQGKTIVMVTHEKGEIPGATRRITLQDGEIRSDEKMILSAEINQSKRPRLQPTAETLLQAEGGGL